jgi:hypothetical protein
LIPVKQIAGNSTNFQHLKNINFPAIICGAIFFTETPFSTVKAGFPIPFREKIKNPKKTGENKKRYLLF